MLMIVGIVVVVLGVLAIGLVNFRLRDRDGEVADMQKDSPLQDRALNQLGIGLTFGGQQGP